MGMIYGSINHTACGRKKETTRRTRPTFKGVRSNSPKPYRRDSEHEYRSAPDTVGVAPRVDPMQYTGRLVKGIGTMHKSNAVPVIDEQHMKDIARMRR
jgi:hypothetical protein